MKFSRISQCGVALFMVFRLDSKDAKVCKSCSSLQELSNEYQCILAKIVFDTAENGPLKVRQKLAKLKVTN